MSAHGEIARRWNTYHDRGAHDYTDEGCRVLAEHAFKDVAALLAALDALEAERAQLLEIATGANDQNEFWMQKAKAAETALARKDEALRAVLDCRGSYNGTVTERGGEPAVCTKCEGIARAALAEEEPAP